MIVAIWFIALFTTTRSPIMLCALCAAAANALLSLAKPRVAHTALVEEGKLTSLYLCTQASSRSLQIEKKLRAKRPSHKSGSTECLTQSSQTLLLFFLLLYFNCTHSNMYIFHEKRLTLAVANGEEAVESRPLHGVQKGVCCCTYIDGCLDYNYSLRVVSSHVSTL